MMMMMDFGWRSPTFLSPPLGAGLANGVVTGSQPGDFRVPTSIIFPIINRGSLR